LRSALFLFSPSLCTLLLAHLSPANSDAVKAMVGSLLPVNVHPLPPLFRPPKPQISPYEHPGMEASIGNLPGVACQSPFYLYLPGTAFLPQMDSTEVLRFLKIRFSVQVCIPFLDSNSFLTSLTPPERTRRFPISFKSLRSPIFFYTSFPSSERSSSFARTPGICLNRSRISPFFFP